MLSQQNLAQRAWSVSATSPQDKNNVFLLKQILKFTPFAVTAV